MVGKETLQYTVVSMVAEMVGTRTEDKGNICFITLGNETP